jgi:biotin carboxyl carrier protein
LDGRHHIVSLRSPTPAFGFDDAMWAKVRAAHAGHQLGLEILAVLPMIAARVGFYDLALNEDMSIAIPDRLLDAARQETMRKVLAPPPPARADEIVAAMGGTYYPQEAPHLPPFVGKGAHFNQGDPLYIIEVMKMFNKVYAPFSGTVDEVLIAEGGVVVRKGQPLFKVTPDEAIEEEDPDVKEHRIRVNTDAYLAQLL